MLDSETRKKLRNIVILGVVVTFMFTTSAYTYGLLTNQNAVNTSGIIADLKIGVYSNAGCTQNQTSIDWGICYPNDNKTTVMYIKNLGTLNANLLIQTGNWNPYVASSYLTLSSSYSGQTITPEQVLQVSLTLNVSPNIKEITTFTFDIYITSQG